MTSVLQPGSGRPLIYVRTLLMHIYHYLHIHSFTCLFYDIMTTLLVLGRSDATFLGFFFFCSPFVDTYEGSLWLHGQLERGACTRSVACLRRRTRRTQFYCAGTSWSNSRSNWKGCGREGGRGGGVKPTPAKAHVRHKGSYESVWFPTCYRVDTLRSVAPRGWLTIKAELSETNLFLCVFFFFFFNPLTSPSVWRPLALHVSRAGAQRRDDLRRTNAGVLLETCSWSFFN